VALLKANIGIPLDLEWEEKHLKKGQSAFWRKGNISVQVRKDKRPVQIISMIHNTTVVNTGRKDRKTNPEIKKPYAVFRYNKFITGIDTADHYLTYYSILRKTVRWLNVSATLCTLFNAYFVYKITNTKIQHRNFLHKETRSWILEVQFW
jgi:hypothetical protein